MGVQSREMCHCSQFNSCQRDWKLLLEGNLHLSVPAPTGMEKPGLGPAWRKELYPCAWFLWLLGGWKVSEKATELLPSLERL